MKIAVLSRNGNLYSTRRLLEAGRQKGHEMLLLDHLKCYVSIEKSNPEIHFEGKKIEGVDAIIPRIGASVTFYGCAIVRQFEMMGVVSSTESQAIVRSRDKLRSLQILSRAGVDMPITGFARSAKDTTDIIKMVGGTPLVIKLLEGTQGIGVVLAETRKAAESVLDAFYGLKTNILIQEFIKESKGTDIRAFIIDGKVVGAMKRTGKEGDFRSNLHRGGTATAIKLSAAERKTAIKAAKALGLAVAGVDMLQSNRGPLVMEVNSSPGLEGIERSTGIDIAGRIIDYLEAKPSTISSTKDKIGV
ncbi:MAG: 30S ribosomal protein S6--L-glutamate ligase [Balneolales bacterium]|nr:30S ribosomal protein S6--L-glutamate ligase [Balneolales bacterium]